MAGCVYSSRTHPRIEYKKPRLQYNAYQECAWYQADRTAVLTRKHWYQTDRAASSRDPPLLDLVQPHLPSTCPPNAPMPSFVLTLGLPMQCPVQTYAAMRY
eukprot:1202312-Rhodomonas_salina.1